MLYKCLKRLASINPGDYVDISYKKTGNEYKLTISDAEGYLFSGSVEISRKELEVSLTKFEKVLPQAEKEFYSWNSEE